ncbi:MAG: hypothetical protein A2622_09690 [Bdellovibrionales bacterium RIFCSPHIGHO2_01_FULL_40_29]|nr:MAG: hypothetical protein A2622_09690 [Bdellovibrionales bacterium RIFCSPHIGHO2_01_FULL_40_29]OFZ32477.1 MAG: hypothetical protein A3D17_12975 [Bdellovibrionales bacterium RIFCSPHIGHO2_02_FULL_40_15]
MSWEFDSKTEMYNLLVGKHYGANPENISANIDQDRVKIGKAISSYLQLKSTDHVLEIGSGSGDMAARLAPQLERLYCADISLSFLEIAQKKCEKWSHVSFHHLQSFDLDFIEPGTLDAIYSHAVFIHLNLYDFYWYFKIFSAVLKENGLIYIDFLSSKNLNLTADSYFSEHAGYYRSSKNSLSSLLSFHNPQAIIDLAQHFNLQLEVSWSSKSGTVGLILRKLESPYFLTLIYNRLRTLIYLIKLRITRRFFSR